MYKSKKQIEKKLQQVKYSQNLIRKYQGKVLANNGIDPATGAHPLVVHMSAFISQARSVIQYAHKEAKETGNLAAFELFVAKSKFLQVFQRLRNFDVHESPLGVHTTIHARAYFDLTGRSQNSPKPDGTDSKTQSDVKVVHTLLEKVDTTEPLCEDLERSGQIELLQAARSGKELYAKIDFDGNRDLHELCDMYITELERFVAYGQANGFIS